MKQLPALFLISFIFAALILSVTVSQNSFAKSAKDSKARRDIDKSIGRAVEGAFSKIKTVNISTYAVPNESITVYNVSSKGSVLPRPPIPPVEPQICNRNDHLSTEGICIPDNPTLGYKICMVGDFKDAKVFDAMKAHECNYRVALGDNGYSDSLELLKSINPDKAVCGNHDDTENGNDAIKKECLAYTGNSWWVKFGSGTLMLGFNTQGDTTKQLDAAKNLFYDTGFMQGVKNVILLSHKGGHVPPNAHHPAEAKAFYTELEAAIPTTVKLFEAAGHNHQSAAADTKGWYISGLGGKSAYACGVNQDWTFCNNKDLAYLQFNIDNNATITAHFINTSGKTIH